MSEIEGLWPSISCNITCYPFANFYNSTLGNFVFNLLYLLAFPLKRKQGLKLFVTVALFGCSIIEFAISRSFILSFAVLLISGIADGINSVISGTIIQVKTPEQMRGRVMSINSLFTNSSNELGRLESGLAASVLGTMPSVLFGGGMTLLIVFIVFFYNSCFKKTGVLAHRMISGRGICRILQSKCY